MRGTRFCTERDVAIRRNSTLPTLDGRPVRTCGGTVRIPRARCHCHSLSLRARAPVVAGRVGSFDVPSQRVRGGQSKKSAAPSHMTPAPCPRQARAPPPPRERRIAPQHAEHTPAHRPPRALSSTISPIPATPMPSPANSQHTLRTPNQHLPNIPSPGTA